jgi:hypothetical protein
MVQLQASLVATVEVVVVAGWGVVLMMMVRI